MRAIVVDDEPRIRKGLRSLIESAYGWSVDEIFSDAQTAREYLKTNNVDLIVTDIRMPLVSGLDLIYQIREVNQEIAIIIVSGYSDFSYAQKAIELGVRRYLTKPTNPEELFKVLEEIRINKKEKVIQEAPANQLIMEIQKFIANNYSRKLSLREIAQEMYISPNYLCDLFKRCTNKTLMEYITQYRITRAKEFLGDVKYRVNDVAQMTGFSDAQYFSNIFKRNTGMTPTEYRNGKTKSTNN